jgi:hypothetical protein
MKLGPGIIFVSLIALATACSSMGGLDSGGYGGAAAPGGQAGFGQQTVAGGPGSPGSPGSIGANGGVNGSNAGGPTAGPNGVAQLVNPGATLAPSQARYPIAGVSNGMNCPSLTLQGQIYSCTLALNLPATPSPGPSASSAATATPSPSPSSSASPTPTPPGNLTLQAEALPPDVPSMTNPDMRALKIVPVAALRVQGDTDFHVNGTATATFTLPATQTAGRQFALQLYDETFPRTIKGSKRTDTFLTGLTQYTTGKNGSAITFTFGLPSATVKSTDIWLLVLYGLTYPPNNSPSPSPSASASSSASPSSAATPASS